jgi:hypothetical protein
VLAAEVVVPAADGGGVVVELFPLARSAVGLAVLAVVVLAAAVEVVVVVVPPAAGAMVKGVENTLGAVKSFWF